jgi:hypothetical protein
MAYKNLLGLRYVLKKFKQMFLPAMATFFNSLPLQVQGIPLNSGVSKALAPLIYVPFFIDLKKQEALKFLVFVDDMVLLCKNKQVAKEVYIAMFNFLKSVALHINLHKIQQGYFSTAKLTYCGYVFSGGYVSISEEKIIAFKSKIALFCSSYKMVDEVALIKRINQLINGFGHYYKCGNVKGVFEKLDSYIRSKVRTCYLRSLKPYPRNKYLKLVGLRSLVAILNGKKPRNSQRTKKKYVARFNKTITPNTKLQQTTALVFYLEKITHQNAEIIGQIKTGVKEL